MNSGSYTTIKGVDGRIYRWIEVEERWEDTEDYEIVGDWEGNFYKLDGEKVFMREANTKILECLSN